MPGLFADTAPLDAGDKKTPAPPPPAAPTPPPAAPAAVKPPEKKPFDPKAGAQKLHNLLTTPVDPDTGEPKPPEKKPEEPAKPGDDPKPPEKQIKTPKKKEPEAPKPEARPPLPTAKKLEGAKPAEPAAPAAPTPPAPAEEDDETFEKGLTEEEKVLLADSRDAARVMPDKYKAQGDKMMKFLREAARKEKDVEAGDLTEAKYEEWYQANRPRIGVLDWRTIQHTRATEDVRKDLEPKLEEERHTRWVETETPKVEAHSTQIRQEIWENVLPDTVMNAAKERLKDITDPKEREKVIGEVRKEFAMEIEVATSITDAAKADIQEFIALTTINPATRKPLHSIRADAEVFDPVKGKYVPNLNAVNPEARQQAQALAMIIDICDDFSQNGAADRVRDGKWFVTREEYGNLPEEERGKWWTFTDKEILDRAKGRVKGFVAQAIEARIKYLDERGFRRGAAAAPTPPAPAAPPSPPSRGAPAAPRPAPPPAGPAPTLTPLQQKAKSLAAKLESQPSEV